jgi:glycogen debranching enzyme
LDPRLLREWLLANELGGSASGTLAGAHTRRTHGLLVAASPHGRLVTLLLKVDERVQLPGASYELGCNIVAPDLVRPPGHLHLEEFTLDPWPRWRYRAGEVALEKTLFMIGGHNAVVVSWRHLEGPPARLIVSPLVVARDPHTLRREDASVRGVVQSVPGRVRIETFESRPTLTLWHNGAFMPTRVWQRGLAYPLDGPAASEDAFVPGYVEGSLAPHEAMHVVASAEDDLFRALASEDRLGTPPPRTLAACVEVLERGEREQSGAWMRECLAGADYTARQAAAAHGGLAADAALRTEPLVGVRDGWTAPLARALHYGLARRVHRLALVRSLPSATESSEAALRALPALVALRDFDAVRELLRGAVEFLDEGLAPERFDVDTGLPAYGDPAPSLWLVAAADLYARRTEDFERLRDPIYPALESVMHFYRSGTRGGVRVDERGLLVAGKGEAAIRRADLNALWYHALVAMAQLARLVGRRENGAFYLAWAREHQKSFLESFWDEGRGALHDTIGEDGPRAGLSPSQLLAVSLPPSLLPAERAATLLATIERELVTPWGLRPAPGVNEALPEWLGPFLTASLRIHQRGPEAQVRARAHLEHVLGPASTGPLLVPERFVLEGTGARPSGDPLSLVAVAELLRAWIEDMDHVPEVAAVG